LSEFRAAWSGDGQVRGKRVRKQAERDLADIDAVFSALAHSSRRHILLVLHFRGGRMTAGEIANRFGGTWPTPTHHLRLLEIARLVKVERHGRERVYILDAARLAHVAHGWLKSFASPAEETK